MRLRGGTTLVECLVAVVLLGVCAVPALNGVAESHVRANSAREQLAVLAELQNELDTKRAQAKNGTIMELSLEREVTLAYVSDAVLITTSVSLVAGYTNLYQVTSHGAWGDHQELQLVTYMRKG